MLYCIQHISNLSDYSVSHVDFTTHCEFGRSLCLRIITVQCLHVPPITLVEVLHIGFLLNLLI